jgi:transposase-like protein
LQARGRQSYALKQAELSISVEEVCRKMGISSATLYKWRQKYAGGKRPANASCMTQRKSDADLEFGRRQLLPE